MAAFCRKTNGMTIQKRSAMVVRRYFASRREHWCPSLNIIGGSYPGRIFCKDEGDRIVARRAKSKRNAVAGIFFFLLILVAGLLLGTQSTLVLERDAAGQVRATNSWRLHDTVTLISRSVSNLREARMAQVNLTVSERRSSIHRDVFGMFINPEELRLIGDDSLAYPYREDQSLIQSFLRNPQSTRSVITHPVDIRRTVSSWVLLAFAALAALGWIVTLVLGRDPLAGKAEKVKPLPPAIGLSLFAGFILLAIAFFNFGDQFFGPLATRKVNLLMESARNDDATGIERAVASGVFVDVRDDQGGTALMEAARHGARRAAEALLRAHASPDLRSGSNDSALDLAINGEHEALALQLIDVHADIHAGGIEGRTPLHLAAHSCTAQVLNRLIALGANIAQKDEQGWTPLMAASASGKAACVRDLLAAGADPSVALPDGRRAADIAMAMANARPPGYPAEDGEILRLLRP